METVEVLIKDVNWIGEEVPEDGLQVSAKVRSTRPGKPATLKIGKAGMARIIFDDCESGVAAGQAAVFYDGDRMLGGGWISASVSADPRLA